MTSSWTQSIDYRQNTESLSILNVVDNLSGFKQIPLPSVSIIIGRAASDTENILN